MHYVCGLAIPNRKYVYNRIQRIFRIIVIDFQFTDDMRVSVSVERITLTSIKKNSLCNSEFLDAFSAQLAKNT